MIKQKLLPDILRAIIDRITYTVDYVMATNNSDGTFTLSGVCDLHHIQPGFTITIGSDSFKVIDYSVSPTGFTIDLDSGGNSLPAQNNSFNLYPAYFFHGTPIKAENDLSEINDLAFKTPMIYLMEPFRYSEVGGYDSAIWKADVTLCFLTQANPNDWRTEDYYHYAINPMYNLAQDFFEALQESGAFYTDGMSPSYISHTDFEIRIKDPKEKGQYFNDNLSGVSCDVTLLIYKDLSCCALNNLLSDDTPRFIQVD